MGGGLSLLNRFIYTTSKSTFYLARKRPWLFKNFQHHTFGLCMALFETVYIFKTAEQVTQNKDFMI